MTSTVTKIVRNLTWTDNPNQGYQSTATVTDNSLTDLNVPGTNGGNIIFTMDIPTLSHLKNVITDILNITTPQ